LERMRARLHKCHALGTSVAFRLGMKNVSVCGNDEPEPGIGCPEAIIVLLPVAIRETVFVEEANLVYDLARHTEAKAVNQRNTGKYAVYRPLLAITVHILSGQSWRHVVDRCLVIGIPVLWNRLMAGRIRDGPDNTGARSREHGIGHFFGPAVCDDGVAVE